MRIDDPGRNIDLDDAWEMADIPRFPEGYAAAAYRYGVRLRPLCDDTLGRLELPQRLDAFRYRRMTQEQVLH